MIAYLSNFAKTGDPNGKGFSKCKPITEDSLKSLRFGDEKAKMYEPSLEKLEETQNTHPAFPYK